MRRFSSDNMHDDNGRKHYSEGRGIPNTPRFNIDEHIPPHIRHYILGEEFDNCDWRCLDLVFKSEEEANAAYYFLRDVAPPEMRAIAIHVRDIFESIVDIDSYVDERMDVDIGNDNGEQKYNVYGYSNRFLNTYARGIYEKLYGGDSKEYIKALGTAPKEIAVISRMLVFIMDYIRR